MKIGVTLALCLFSIRALADNPPPATSPIQLQFIQPDTVQEDLLGKVKSVESISYKMLDGSDGPLEGKKLETYNDQGCSTEKSSWDESGNLKDHKVWSYDAQGNILKRDSLGANGEVLDTSSPRFDPKASKVTVEAKKADGAPAGKKIYTYDYFGKEHEVLTYNSAGALTGRTTMARNGRGKEITVTFFDKDGQTKTVIKLKWNPDGSPSEEQISGLKDGVVSTNTFEYSQHDSQGNWTKRTERQVFEKNGQMVGQGGTVVERTLTYY